MKKETNYHFPYGSQYPIPDDFEEIKSTTDALKKLLSVVFFVPLLLIAPIIMLIEDEKMEAKNRKSKIKE